MPGMGQILVVFRQRLFFAGRRNQSLVHSSFIRAFIEIQKFLLQKLLGRPFIATGMNAPLEFQREILPDKPIRIWSDSPIVVRPLNPAKLICV